MALHYFHYSNGQTTLDSLGTDLPDLSAIRAEAIQALRELLNLGGPITGPWMGDPWRIWVTDEPDANGRTILTLEVTSR